ncbi:SNARE sec71 [Schizosaccharomyces japonicus yFS275]|uniref:SNARE sec71 n=1 Tax=Schizosaccharomyces japonicus (strain yFS275 / FY16936) TaxID=402676 RepID=B6K1P9_SCHJY|nr:SNARE sec71 [Schizosaccharomyces japonicus yFS275]EEB07080.1 SNARE sec71 [Schizosaccharomyces japonicus yFS275]
MNEAGVSKSNVEDEIERIPEKSPAETSAAVEQKPKPESDLSVNHSVADELNGVVATADSVESPTGDQDAEIEESETDNSLTIQQNDHASFISERSRVDSVSTGSSSTVKPVEKAGKIYPKVFVFQAFEELSKAKAVKRNKKLRESVDHVLSELQKQPFLLPEALLEPLALACSTSSKTVLTITLDCLSKLITYNYFDVPHLNASELTLMEKVVNIIASCFGGESTPEKVQLQIVKALLAAVTSKHCVIRHSSLLMAVRQTYNIFLLCKNPSIQAIAQVALTQMIDSAFQRLSVVLDEERIYPTEDETSTTSEKTRDPVDKTDTATIDNEETQKITLESFENRKSFEQVREEAPPSEQSLEQQLLRDAFLLFRALCKLSIKPISYDNEYDLRLHSMRSKLMSLHLIYRILSKHMNIFTNTRLAIQSSSSPPTPFIYAIKQYLCLSLSKNAVSHVLPVFEISCEIFWLVLKNMKNLLKEEIEVFFTGIFFPIFEMKSSTAEQKIILLNTFYRISREPQTLIELYLNYDCAGGNTDNIYEHMINVLSKTVNMNMNHPPVAELPSGSNDFTEITGYVYKTLDETPVLNVSAVSIYSSLQTPPHLDYQIKVKSFKCLLSAMVSLISWCKSDFFTAASGNATDESNDETSRADDASTSFDNSTNRYANSSSDVNDGASTRALDDPSQFESLKHRKNQLHEAIKKFNFNSKHGLKMLLSHEFIKSDSPEDIAYFLLHTEGLDKTMIGEYLGEGNEKSISVMHALVDQLNFKKLPFVSALRQFLQCFRLPGEAQKIDRFMLKFAEKYVVDNLGVFRNADTAYVLAYSIIMLNTDQHSPQVKNKMTKTDFIKNNRGVDDGADLSDEYLAAIYDDIQKNEIVLKTKDEIMGPSAPWHNLVASLGGPLKVVAKDVQREAYYMASNRMATKAEELFKDLLRQQKHTSSQIGKNIYYIASHWEHVGPMFEVVWMPILAALSIPLQLSMDDALIRLSLNGFELALDIVCLFDLELPKNAYIQTLTKFTHLSNISEMQSTNIYILHTLLSIALIHGNELKDSWLHVLRCVSQFERLQLITAGVSGETIPDVSFGKVRRSFSSDHKDSAPAIQKSKHVRSISAVDSVTPEIAEKSRSRELIVAVDKLFSSTVNLSGEAVSYFVKALIDVSWEEINISAELKNPRMFGIQKIVELCYYNMGRIRMEWSNIWTLLGDYFNKVGCHRNPVIASFALDSLRQLSMQFLEIDELSHFKFQKAFLHPFLYAMENSSSDGIKDLILHCVLQIIKARSQNIRSGWRTIFMILTSAAEQENASLLNTAFAACTLIFRSSIKPVLSQHASNDMLACFASLAIVNLDQKLSLGSLELIKRTEDYLLVFEDEDSQQQNDEAELKYLRYSYLESLIKVIKCSHDLEVRSRALSYFFDSLTKNASKFSDDFLFDLCQELIMPLFAINDQSQLALQEEEGDVWVLTTMVEALRYFLEFIEKHFPNLQPLFSVLVKCLEGFICQENSMLSKIGVSCLSEFIQQNAQHFVDENWKLIVKTYEDILDRSLPVGIHALAARIGEENKSVDADQASLEHQTGQEVASSNNSSFKANRLKNKQLKAVVIKCSLQLLILESLESLLTDKKVLCAIPTSSSFNLLLVIKRSWTFAVEFNNDSKTRLSLYNTGFMSYLPNLLGQESLCATIFLKFTFSLLGKAPTDSENMTTDELESKVFEQLKLALQLVQQGYSRVITESSNKGIASYQSILLFVSEAVLALPPQHVVMVKSMFYNFFAYCLQFGQIDKNLGQSLSKFFLRTADMVETK